jgi:hypothetical protein
MDIEASETDEDCVTVDGMTREDRRVRLREIAVLTDIAFESSYLNFRKVYALCVSKMTTRCRETKEWLLLLKIVAIPRWRRNVRGKRRYGT